MKRLLIALGLALALAAPAAGYPGPNSTGMLGILMGANFNSTADQAITIPPQVTKYRITSIEVTNCSASLTLAAGGFYSAASKGGTAIVAAAQVYSAATGATVIVNPTISATGGSTAWTVGTVYLSLTTAQGGTATCNVAIFGVDLSGL